MWDFIQLIYKGLLADATVTNIFGNKIFPLLAPQKTQAPYITFRVRQIGPASKDGVHDYEVIIDNFQTEDKFDEASTESETVNAAFRNLLDASDAQIYKFKQGVKEPFLTERLDEIYYEQNYSLTI